MDQLTVLGPSALQTVGCGILAMCLVGAAFLPNLASLFLVSSAVLSIAAGVMGLTALAGGELDHVSLCCFLGCIGLSIDFSVHVAIRMARATAGGAPVAVAVADTLSGLGWALLEAGASSMVAVGALALAPSYVAAVFARSVAAVMALGLLHGLLWLPLAHTPGGLRPLRGKAERGQE